MRLSKFHHSKRPTRHLVPRNTLELSALHKYQELKREMRRLWKMRNAEIVPVVIEALGSVSTEFDRWMGKLGITCNVGVMQKTALLGTAKILRKVLEM